MFDSKTRQGFVKLTFSKYILNAIYVVVITVVSFYVLWKNIINEDNIKDDNVIICVVVPILSSTGWFMFIKTYDTIAKHLLRKKFIRESLEIVHEVKMPKKLPKVVYLYTTHNDFMPARILQSSQQTYKNMEVWISDGSDKESCREQIRQFAKKHNFKLYQMDITGSQNKADNVNHFLKHSGANFDFLMYCDADEVFDKNFVETSIRFFYSKKIKNLAYVTPINQTYKTKYLYTNICRSANDIIFFKQTRRAYSLFDYSNLYGASALISGKFINSMNKHFPDGCLDDWYSEAISLKSGWFSMFNVLTVCLQEYDVSIKHTLKREMRVWDWILKWCKNKPLGNFNEKYLHWFVRTMLSIMFPILLIGAAVAMTTIVWVLASYWNIVWHSAYFLSYITANLFILVIALLVTNWDTGKIIGKKNSFLFPLFVLFLGAAHIPSMVVHWWNSVVRSNYSEFGGSPKKYFDSGFMQIFSKVRNDAIMFALTTAGLAVFNYCFVQFGLIDSSQPWLFVIYIFFNIIIGLFFFSYLSILFLYGFSFVPSNKRYSSNKFVYYKNDYVSGKKIKDKFYKKNSEFERIC